MGKLILDPVIGWPMNFYWSPFVFSTFPFQKIHFENSDVKCFTNLNNRNTIFNPRPLTMFFLKGVIVDVHFLVGASVGICFPLQPPKSFPRDLCNLRDQVLHRDLLG